MIKSLDDVTILRFAKAFRSGGGMEKYLEDLDSILLKRNKITLIRLYLDPGTKTERPTIKKIGKGNLIEIPMPVREMVNQFKPDYQKYKESGISFIKIIFREWIIYNPLLYHYLLTPRYR